MKEVSSFLAENIDSPTLLGALFILCWFLWITKGAWSEVIKKSDPLNKLFEHLGGIAFKKKHSIKELHNHSVFNQLENLKSCSHVFKTYEEDDWHKTVAFREFLESKMESTKVHIHKIIDEASPNMNKIELRNLIGQRFNDCNCNLEEIMMERFHNSGLSKKDSIILMDKFLGLRTMAVNNYSKTFDGVFSDQALSTNYHILTCVFHLLHNEGIRMVDDCIMAFEEVNGAFMKIKYADKKI